MNLLVRHGPAPEDTKDAAGELHSTFTGFFVLPLSEADAQELFGPDTETDADADAGTNAAFTRLVRQIWDRVTAPKSEEGLGDGHILIGAHSGFEYVARGAGPACGYEGLVLGTTSEGMPFAPKDYVPLFAVARAKKPDDAPEDAPSYIDLAVDYRDTRGPGDETIRPHVFATGDP